MELSLEILILRYYAIIVLTFGVIGNLFSLFVLCQKKVRSKKLSKPLIYLCIADNVVLGGTWYILSLTYDGASTYVLTVNGTVIAASTSTTSYTNSAGDRFNDLGAAGFRVGAPALQITKGVITTTPGGRYFYFGIFSFSLITPSPFQ